MALIGTEYEVDILEGYSITSTEKGLALKFGDTVIFTLDDEDQFMQRIEAAGFIRHVEKRPGQMLA